MATGSTIITKQHDTKIVFTHTPTIDDVPMQPADLIGCTVSFLLKDVTGVIAAIKQPATITGAVFSYQPVASDVANVGKFQQEWELIFPPGPPNGKILTFPNNTYNVVKILADLG
jgi:hypothetical protein